MTFDNSEEEIQTAIDLLTAEHILWQSPENMEPSKSTTANEIVTKGNENSEIATGITGITSVSSGALSELRFDEQVISAHAGSTTEPHMLFFDDNGNPIFIDMYLYQKLAYKLTVGWVNNPNSASVMRVYILWYDADDEMFDRSTIAELTGTYPEPFLHGAIDIPEDTYGFKIAYEMCTAYKKGWNYINFAEHPSKIRGL